MDIETFIQNFADQFDDEPEGLTLETRFRDIDGWSSLVALSEMAMCDEEYEVILGLRLLKGISLKDYKEKFNIELIEKYDYRELVEEKLLVLKDNYLFIPEDKIYISNEIIVRLLEKEV